MIVTSDSVWLGKRIKVSCSQCGKVEGTISKITKISKSNNNTVPPQQMWAPQRSAQPRTQLVSFNPFNPGFGNQQMWVPQHPMQPQIQTMCSSSGFGVPQQFVYTSTGNAPCMQTNDVETTKAIFNMLDQVDPNWRYY